MEERLTNTVDENQDYSEVTESPVMVELEETGSSHKAAKVLGGLAVAAVVGGLTYKLAVKPIINKIKAKKAAKEANKEAAAKTVVLDKDGNVVK